MIQPGLWKVEDNVLLRGIYEKTLAYGQSLRVIKDTPEEIALFIWPGTECVTPLGCIADRREWGVPAQNWDEVNF